MAFQPVPIEVLSGWHEACVRLVRQKGQEQGEVVRHLFGKLSILLMCWTAQLVLNRMHQSDHQTEGIL